MATWIAILSISFAVFLFHNTDAILHYFKLFGLEYFLLDYIEWKKSNPDFLPAFWRDTVKGGQFINWLVALLGCPVCLCAFICLFSGKLFLFYGFLTVIAYMVITILYKLLNKFYE